MLVELNMVEQRYQAVLEVVRDGATVVEVARRSGVSRQTVHVWLKRYAAGGLTGLADVLETGFVSASDATRGRSETARVTS